MKPYQANLINGIVLVVMSLWGYFSSADPSPTALIPAAFGAIFIILTPGMKSENKVVAHILVLFTLLIVVALYMPLRAAVNREDTMAIVRVSLMMLTSLIALISFVRSFIEVRRQRKAEQQ